MNTIYCVCINRERLGEYFDEICISFVFVFLLLRRLKKKLEFGSITLWECFSIVYLSIKANLKNNNCTYFNLTKNI